MTINSLILRAEKILSCESEDEEIIKLLPVYIEAFDRWMKDPGSMDKEVLEKLHRYHGEVLEKAISIKSATREAMKSLRQRGRGLKAYIDHYPKRVSLRRGRKG